MAGALAALLAVAALAAPPATTTAAAALTPVQLAGQRIVWGFPGTSPPPSLIRRIRRGQVGAVILLGGNIRSRAGARALIARLQAVPRPPGLREPLLVMVDQEGGPVRRLTGPPARSAAELGASGPRAARAAGRAAGRLLVGVGVNVDLAPVADLALPGGAIGRERRSFGRSPLRVARDVVAFAGGLRSAGVLATAKHFPGFGGARINTDYAPAVIRRSAGTLRVRDMRPFRALIAHRVPLVMVASAVYPALDRRAPASLSRRIVTGELRGRMGFGGVVVTDTLDTPALGAVGGTGAVALRAVRAGDDLLIHTGYRAGVIAERALARAIARGRVSRAAARASVARVLALRAALPRP